MRRDGIGWALATAWLLLAWAVAAVAQTAGDEVGSAPAVASTAARVRADLEAFIRERVEGEPRSIDLPSLRAFDFEVAAGAGEVRTELSSQSEVPLQGRVAISVSLFVGDRLLKRGVVSPHVAMPDRVLVATRSLARGHVLSPADLVLVERDRSTSPRDVLRAPREVVGLRVKRSLPADQILRAQDVEPVPVVERGDRVTLVLQRGALMIQATGKAQETGGIGDWIRVVNLDSKREISGRVDQEGRVHVAF